MPPLSWIKSLPRTTIGKTATKLMETLTTPMVTTVAEGREEERTGHKMSSGSH